MYILCSNELVPQDDAVFPMPVLSTAHIGHTMGRSKKNK